MDASPYFISNTEEIISPGLVIFHELLVANIEQMIAIAGGPGRLRPHCKTHKMREVAELQLKLGIAKHKCATFAEAEMLVEAGARDVFLAYNLVGPNVRRAVAFRRRFPEVVFSVTADHPAAVDALSRAMRDSGCEIEVVLDIDSGQHRTGLPPGPDAVALYERIAESPGLVPGGLHLYDGQNHQTDLDQRREAVGQVWRDGCGLRDQLAERGLPVPRIVAGGTGSFPVFAGYDDPALELSPGTVVFFDVGYGEIFPDLKFTPAALLLTRVISRPTANRVTLDLGYKAVASDPPAGKRLAFPALPDAREVLQNEEHLVLETAEAEKFQPGDELLAIPRHTCPTSALHEQAWVIQGGNVVDHWKVASRARRLTI